MSTGNGTGKSLQVVCQTLASEEMGGKIGQALLAGVDRARFIRTTLTAIQTNPSLVECDKGSLYNAVLRAAQDGLLPDGREGALVPFKGKCQWMPMAYGIRKRLAKCKILVEAHVVYSNDEFQVSLGDEPHIHHIPGPLDAVRGEMIGAYAIATTADGQKLREIMTKDQIEAVQKQSRAADSLMWTQFKSEAWRKTVLRRLAKAIPALDDSVDDMLKRDDEQYAFNEATDGAAMPETPKEAAKPKRSRALQTVVDAQPQPTATEPPIEDSEPLFDV